MILYIIIPLIILALLLIQLGAIESLILISAFLFSTIIYLAVVCLNDDNKCMTKTNSGFQMMLPLMGYLAPFQNLKQNGFMQFLKNMISFRTPYIYNLIGLIIGFIFVYAYRIGEEQEVQECGNEKKEIINKIKEAKEKDDIKREKEEKIMEEKINLLREREDILMEEVQENEKKKKEIRDRILQMVNIEEEN